MGVLHEPLAIGGSTTVRNRLYRAPVLEGAGDGDDCADIYARHFVENARHGVGLIIQGSACLYAEGRTSPGMTCVDRPEKVARLAPMVDEVHRAGAAIWLQVGHGGLYAMEAWHEPYAGAREEPLRAVSPVRWYLRPTFRRVPVDVLTTEEVHDLAHKYGDVAAWAREAGYDGMQLASSNAKLLDQFLSPFYNRRDDEFGGSVEARARVLRIIRERVAEKAGPDFTVAVKIPLGEKSPPGTPHVSVADGLRIASLVEEWGFDAVTPVEVSVFPDTTLSRGGVPRSLWDNNAMVTKFRTAAPSWSHRKVIEAGYWLGGRLSPFEPVWNRDHFKAVRARVSIPVFAVGGIRTRAEIDGILEGEEAHMVGVGRPFYAEPDIAARLLDDHQAGAACESSNLCVPAQMLGMRGICYNPDVRKTAVELRRGPQA
jgi:2,4-dienoyl-CoA reductase-like NADH-dependent reductase (Old Yellow Enzyme family)